MIGTLVSYYRIVERLGGGGMGVVCEAEEKLLAKKRTLPRYMQRREHP